jgi:hypothetical protein
MRQGVHRLERRRPAEDVPRGPSRLLTPKDGTVFLSVAAGPHGAGIDPRLRTFIHTCIVPILVKQYMGEAETENELADVGLGAARSHRSTATPTGNEEP